jgi:hypothetical protein
VAGLDVQEEMGDGPMAVTAHAAPKQVQPAMEAMPEDHGELSPLKTRGATQPKQCLIRPAAEQVKNIEPPAVFAPPAQPSRRHRIL